MTRHLALFVLALMLRTGISRAATGEAGAADGGKNVGLLAVDAYGVAPQLAKRLRGTVMEALRTEGLRARDFSDALSFVADCHYPNDCLAATVAKLNLDYVLMVRLAPSSATASAKPEHEITVRFGRMPRGLSALGPWPLTTLCRDCSDTELTDAARQLTSSAWKAMLRAERLPQDAELSAQDRRSKGAKLVKLASGEGQSVFEQVYLLKKAVHAGAGGPALLGLSQIFLDCGGYEEAEAYASKAADSGAKVDSIMGRLLWSTGRWWDALAVFQRLVQQDPKDTRLQKTLEELTRRTQDYRSPIGQAEVELKREDPSKAVQLARIALAKKLSGTKLRLILATASMKMAAYADALAQFIAVLDVDPSNADALAGKKQAEDGLKQVREKRTQR